MLTPSARIRLSTWMLVWAVALPASLAHAEPASAPDHKRDVKSWLLRMQDAANRGSYQGTVIFATGGTVTSTSRITHFGDGRDQYERIDVLEGQARHVVRHNEQVHTVWPKDRVVMVEQRDQMSSFPGLLQGSGDRLPDLYELKALGQERVAGREADILSVRPRDAHRYGYRLWADTATGLLLRAEVIGDRGVAIESSAFSDVVINPVHVHPPLEKLTQPIRKLDGYRVLKPVAVATELDAEGWRLEPKVPGFKKVSCVKRPIDGPLRAQPVDNPTELRLVQAVYSDGLTYVSVFIEPYNPERHPRAMHTAIGATQTLMHRQGDWWVTLMGDVPAPTLRLFAEALERRK